MFAFTLNKSLLKQVVTGCQCQEYRAQWCAMGLEMPYFIKGVVRRGSGILNKSGYRQFTINY